MRPTKLFIGGISSNTSTKDMRAHFSQYGRVLDCVAMKRDDGRSRSFGYVTLDSPEAADKCIAVPQVIDSRVVDVKRAVPERPAGKENKTEWDKLSTNNKKKARSPKAGEDLCIARDYSVLLDDQAHPDFKLDVDAPEFVPAALAAVEEVEDDLEEDAAGEVLAPSLEELTRKLITLGAPPGLSLPITGLPTTAIPAPPCMPPPPPPAAAKADSGSDFTKQFTDDAQDYASTVTPSTSPSQSPGTVLVGCDSDADDEVMPKHLPSAGSSLHASGQCRPCNFFAKGRCSNDLDCEFCHLSHQKRKPTRQEKRDRKASWISRQETKLADGQTSGLLNVLTLPLRSAGESSPVAAAPAEAAPVACFINFDDYSDFSDDDDEVAARCKPQGKEAVRMLSWSREEMLRVKVSMTKAC
jgi:hypothetical protein